jgi:NADH-quinone oxidoreductase subunit N
MIWKLFGVEIVLCSAFVLHLLLSMAKNPLPHKTLARVAGGACLLALGLCIWSFGASGSLFAGSYRIDLLSQSFKALVVLGLLFTVFISQTSAIPAKRTPEYFTFLLSGALGMAMLPSSADLLTLYVSMELSSYSLYLLTAFRPDRRNAESSVKYLILGAAASGVFLWGTSLVTAFAGSASLETIALRAPEFMAEPAFFLGLIFMLFAFLFKLSAFPVHFWAPDAYETAATPVTAFIATASKAAAVSLLVRVMHAAGVSSGMQLILGIFAFLSMTLGNTVALMQKDVKRLLAYSSVAQAGYILVGLLAGSMEGYSSSLFYAFAYLLMNAGAFLVVWVVGRAAGRENPSLSDFNGLAERAPKLALLLLLSLLSLAGIPPLAGFTGKWILFAAAMQKGHWFLVLWGVLNSVVSLFYYLTLVKHAYLEKPSVPGELKVSAPVVALGLALAAAIVGLGLFPEPAITLAQKALTTASF